MERASLSDLPYLDVSFWGGLCPDLTITEDRPICEAHGRHTGPELRQGDWELCKQLISEDGYFAYESFFPQRNVDRLAACLKRLDAAGIPPVFCFLYDEFWEVLGQLDPLLADLLGPYTLLPAVWAWIVKPTEQTAFAPHRDQARQTSVDDENHLDYLTLWIPLTDLNHLSSSICIVPASLDADYAKNTQRTRVEDLQDIRSLQVPRGSVLAWTVALAHWGTKQSRFGEPRMSIGYYVQKVSAELLAEPPIDLKSPFSLRSRLQLVGQQILDYSRDRGNELINLAKSLTDLEDV